MSEEINNQQTDAALAANLSLNDLVAVVHILQVVTNRGAFKAEELSTVGGVYERIFNFLEAHGAVERTTETAEEQTSTGEQA